MKKKPVDLAAEHKKAVAPKKGTTKEVAAAKAMGETSKKARDTKALKSVVTSDKGRGKNASNPTAHRKQASNPIPSTPGKQKAAGDALKAVSAAVKKAGRPAKADSVRSIAAAKRAADIASGLRSSTGRGRPKSAANVQAAKAKEEFAAKRKAEGKTTRGRKAKPDSREVQRGVKKVEKTKEIANPTPDKSIVSMKGAPGMKPSEAKAKYSGMKEVARGEDTDGITEKGMHSRGKTAVTYSRGGEHKFQRRTLQIPGKSSVTVLKNLKADHGSDSYKPHHSFRQVDTPTSKIEESVRRHSDASKTMRVKFERNVSGRQSMQTRQGSAKYSPGLTGASGSVHGNLDKISGEGRAALRGTLSSSREGTQHRGFDQPAPKSETPKTKLESSTAKIEPKAISMKKRNKN